MSSLQLRDAIYQQWLHADLNELACPTLPDQNSMAQETLLLQGELCLQVSALISIGESYYGQLRKMEGNIGKDLPDLENDLDPEESSVDPSLQLSSVSIQSAVFSSNRPECQQNTATYALHLTDGVTTIKAVEVGSNKSSNGRAPEECFHVGAKVKIRGPLKLRKGVLMLPSGSISNPVVNSQSKNAQCCLLGGEVEFSDPAHNKPYLLLQRELLTKLNLPPDNPPEWFPCRRALPPTVSSEARASDVDDSIIERQTFPQTTIERSQPPLRRTHRRAIFSEDGDSTSTYQSSFGMPARPQDGNCYQQPLETVAEEQTEFEALFDDDDFLLASVAENFENMASAPGNVIDEPIAPVIPKDPPEQECDYDCLFSNDPKVEEMLREIDFSPYSDAGALSPPTSLTATSSKRPRLSSKRPMNSSVPQPTMKPSTSGAPKQIVFQEPQQGQQRKPQAPVSVVQKNVGKPTMTKVQSDIRRFLGGGTGGSQRPQQHPRREVTDLGELQNARPHFAYLQDIYYKLQQLHHPRAGEVASIRGMLVSVQSRLEHHEGTHWSLAVRLSDGTATVDADVEDELLRRLIGLSAIEAEAMRRLGRQGDEDQKRRLKDIIGAFQFKLCHFSGLFEVVFPESSTSTTPIRPKIRRFQPLDQQWLSQLKNMTL